MLDWQGYENEGKTSNEIQTGRMIVLMGKR